MGDTRFIITAAGQQTRWNGHLGVSKHMALVRGEPIIHRTLRLLTERGQQDIVLIAKDSGYGAYGIAPIVASDATILPLTGLGVSEPHWGPGLTVLLFGDVYFTEQAINTVINVQPAVGDVLWFGRAGEGVAGSHWKELFAVSFHYEAQANLRSHMNRVREVRDSIGRPGEGGWLVYRSLRGLNLRAYYPVTAGNFVDITDETTDFDSPEDYDEFIATMEKKA
jgi:hypothetical protein